MSRYTHSKEPWKVGDGSGIYICTAVGEINIAGLNGTVGKYEIEAKNARRIVACVNACAGVPIEVLENSKDGCVAIVFNENQTLQAQRDELLSALKGMVDRYASLINCGDCGSWDPETEAEVIAARVAIAKAESQL